MARLSAPIVWSHHLMARLSRGPPSVALLPSCGPIMSVLQTIARLAVSSAIPQQQYASSKGENACKMAVAILRSAPAYRAVRCVRPPYGCSPSYGCPPLHVRRLGPRGGYRAPTTPSGQGGGNTLSMLSIGCTCGEPIANRWGCNVTHEPCQESGTWPPMALG